MGLDTVDLIIKLENHFKIEISNREAEKIVTVGDIHDIVLKHLLTDVDQAKVKSTINNIIADHAGLPLSDIAPHKSITTDLGLD